MHLIKESKVQRLPLIILSFFIILQIVGMIYWAGEKQGYHLDEYFTFGLSNYKGDSIHLQF